MAEAFAKLKSKIFGTSFQKRISQRISSCWSVGKSPVISGLSG
jgi:hypothetical protein